MSAANETVCRFVVVSPDGRRSSEWRVWTAQEGKAPSDDVYLAPRSHVVDFKISLHYGDNTGQYGLSQAIRDASRPGDKKALLRWDLATAEIFPGWKPAYLLQFPESELAEVPLKGESAIILPAPDIGSALQIMVLTGTPGAEIPAGLHDGVVGILDRENGGNVVIVSMPTPFDPEVFKNLDSPARTMSGWAIPGTRAASGPFGWVTHQGEGGFVRSTEFNKDLHAEGGAELSLPCFPGIVRPWDERPSVDLDIVCAVLVCPATAEPQLFLDPRSRCNHQHLDKDATDLVRAHQRGETDDNWGRLPNGDLFTCLAMPRVLSELGGLDPSQWAPGPGSTIR